MTENGNRETMTLKGKTKIILAIIGMLTMATPGVLSLVGQFLDRGEEKADAAYQHLIRQVEFTDRQLIEIRKEIVIGDEKLREAIFELALAMKVEAALAVKENKPKSKSKTAVKPTSEVLDDILVSASGPGMSGGSGSDKLGGKSSKVKKAKEVAVKQMEQRPMLPKSLDMLKAPPALEAPKKKK